MCLTMSNNGRDMGSGNDGAAARREDNYPVLGRDHRYCAEHWP